MTSFRAASWVTALLNDDSCVFGLWLRADFGTMSEEIIAKGASETVVAGPMAMKRASKACHKLSFNITTLQLAWLLKIVQEYCLCLCKTNIQSVRMFLLQPLMIIR